MPKKPIEVRVSRTEGTPEGNLLEAEVKAQETGLSLSELFRVSTIS